MLDTEAAILQLRRILSQQIIPRISAAEPLRMILAQRPLRLPPDIQAKRRPAPSLKIGGKRSHLFLAKDRKERMHAIRFPYLCYVVEGEIDMRLGIPAQRGKSRGIVNSYEILTLPAHTALLIPPGVFFPDGSQPHWERSTPPVDARMLWIHILPTGVFCHTSVTQASEHLDIFGPGRHFSLLAEMQMEELQLSDKEAAMVAQNALLLLLSRVLRGLKEGARAAVAPGLEFSEKEDSHKGNSMVIERACDFIRQHNGVSFSVEAVAAYAYVSPSHLMRLFRSELNTTVMEYALAQRLPMAQSWLINSEMSIKQIANFLGYSQTPQFSRVFKRVYGIRPTEFRRKHRSEGKLIVSANER
jgi:AraC-like DNA-binding protein